MAEPPPLPSPPIQPPALAPYPRSGPPEYPPEETDYDDVEPLRRRPRRNEFDEEDVDVRLPRGRRRTRSGGDWTTASVGMKLVFGGMIAFTLGVLVIQAATFGEPPQDPGAPQGQRQNAVAAVGGCFLLISIVILFIGCCLACAAPNRSAHRWALSAVLVSVASVLLSCVGFSVLIWANVNRPGNPVNQAELAVMPAFIVTLIVVALVSIISFVFLMLFHASVARALGNASLLHQSYWYIAVPFAQAGLFLAMNAIVGFQRSRGNEPGDSAYAMLSILMMVTSLATYGWYAAICWQTFRTMDAAGRQRFE
jgi:hypothetical protein